MFTETPTKMKIAMRKISLKEIHERGAAFWSEDEPWLELQVRIWSGAHNAWWRSGGNNVTNTRAQLSSNNTLMSFNIPSLTRVAINQPATFGVEVNVGF